MAGYEATSRIGRIAPRFLPAPPAPGPEDRAMGAVEPDEVTVVDVGGEPRLGGRLGAALEHLRDLASDVREIWVHARRVMSDPGWR